MTEYAIRPKNPAHPNVLIVDTPGFGDTRGLDQDRINMDLITRKFNKYKRLNMVNFVMNSTLKRMGSVERYVFGEGLSMLGQDTENIIYLALTHKAGPGKPALLEQMGKYDYADYTVLNNAALYSPPNEDDDEYQRYWQDAKTGCAHIIDKLGSMQPVDMKQSNEVVKERQKLQSFVAAMRPR